MIEATGLTLRAGGRILVADVSLRLAAGEVLAVVGPNGAGKSSLLRALAGEMRPAAGAVALCGRALRDWPPRALAQRRAVVSQAVDLAFPMTAAEVVALGRLPWHGTPAAAADAMAVAAALRRLGIAALATQAYATLSGGERQRVQVARALAQLAGAERPAALLLDEPTASLDAAHRAALLQEMRRLAGQGFALLVVLHDLNEAAFVADRVLVMADGRSRGLGPPAAVLRADAIGAVYGVPFRPAGDGGLVPDWAGAAGPAGQAGESTEAGGRAPWA
jgi:iron complex transport system ATP-binding protein